MSLPTNPNWVRAFHGYATLAGTVNVLLGAFVLWVWGMGWETWIVTNWQEHAAMRPVAALGLLLGGTSLLLWRHGGDRRWAGWLAQACGLAVFALGTLTLAEYAFSRELGLSLMLFPHKIQVLGAANPGRPSLQTGFSLALIGVGLAALRYESRRGIRPSEVAVIVAALMPFLALLVYAYHLAGLYELFGTLKSVSLSLSSLGLVMLSLGILAACPERGWIRHLASNGPGGVVLRQVLPAFVGVPILVGLLAMMERLTLQPLTTTIGALVLAMTVMLLALIIRSGMQLDDLEASRGEAEAELAERAEALRRSNEQLKEIDRLKTDFVNAVSHELRTPLTSIRGYAEFLEDEIGGALAPEQRTYVEEIQENTHRLQRLVDDLLDFAKLEAGTFRLTLATGDLSARTREVVNSLQPVARQSGVRLSFEDESGPLPITMDAGRIEQVLINLVGNAVKFTTEGGQVRIRTERRPGEVWVGIEDTGIGISPEAIAQLFEKFFQVDNTSTRARGGAGLGLAISKALVEAHGGRIGVESAPGHGSTFWFTLPAGTGQGVTEPLRS
jgi:signal transduction histidine kinase